MSSARHMIALLKSHLDGNDADFLAIAMQAAAHEARSGHANVAQQLKGLVDEVKRRKAAATTRRPTDCTNHPEMLDRALFRRFDDVIEYTLPHTDLAREILVRRLATFETPKFRWAEMLSPPRA